MTQSEYVLLVDFKLQIFVDEAVVSPTLNLWQTWIVQVFQGVFKIVEP